MTGYHVAAGRGWLNDPNGMVHRDGRWHVFFQHNPARAQHGDIHWGHASSADLKSWVEHPVAFGPLEGEPDAAGCWSGVALDLGERVAVAYTACEVDPGTTSVCVRYAVDAGLDDWSAPVVVAHQRDLPPEVGVREMRDPFVFVLDGRRWAVLGAGIGPVGSVAATWRPALLLWSCDDLEQWRFERVWLDTTDPVLADPSTARSNIWECPQLVEVGGVAVLLLSTWVAGELAGVAQASGALAAGPDGTPVMTITGLSGLSRFDTGDDCYAPQVALDAEGPWAFGWVKQDGNDDPDATVGCLTLPRRPTRQGDRVTWVTDPRVEDLVGEPVEPEKWRGALPAACQVTVPGGGVLRRGGQRLELAPGAVVWVDEDVVEAYTPGEPPVTVRWPGPDPWRLDADGAVVRLVASAG